MDSPPQLFMQYLAHIEHFSFNVWKLLLFALILNLWIQTGLNHREVYNSKSGDVASLAEFYCSLIIRASQFSSTTRNLVPRFKRGTKGERSLYESSNESSQFCLLFSKRPVQYIDVFISLLQVIMMKSASFLQELHRTYERIRGGHSGRTGLNKVVYRVDNIEEGGGK